jgi:hypothetical protein
MLIERVAEEGRCCRNVSFNCLDILFGYFELHEELFLEGGRLQRERWSGLEFASFCREITRE